MNALRMENHTQLTHLLTNTAYGWLRFGITVPPKTLLADS